MGKVGRGCAFEEATMKGTRAGAPSLRRLSVNFQPTACAGCVLATLLVLTICSLPGQGSSRNPLRSTRHLPHARLRNLDGQLTPFQPSMQQRREAERLGECAGTTGGKSSRSMRRTSFAMAGASMGGERASGACRRSWGGARQAMTTDRCTRTWPPCSPDSRIFSVGCMQPSLPRAL